MERKRFYQYLWSAILTSLSSTLCVQVDGIVVSHLLGAEAFAAIGVLMPLVQMQFTLCLLIGVGGALQLSFAVGAQDAARHRRVLLSTVILLALACLPFVVLSLWSQTVAGWFCHEVSLLPLATEYGRVLLLSAPVYFLLQGCSAMVRAEGFPTRILVAMVLANVLNISLDVLFIAGFGSGIAGAGWATTVSNVIALVIILTRRTVHTANHTGVYPRLINASLIRAIFASGAPMALGSVAMFIRLSYLTATTSSRLGAEGVITLSLLMSVFLIVNLLAGGPTQALQPLAGQYIGQGNQQAMYRTCARSLNFTALSSLVVTVLVIVFAQPLCRLYGIDIQHSNVLSALRIFALCYVFYSLGYVMMVVHQVWGNRSKSMLIAVVQPLMVVPVFAYLSANHQVFTINAVWWAFPIADLIGLIFIISLSTHEIRQIYATAKCC